MSIERKLEDGRLTLKVGGRLDTNTSPELEEALKADGVKEMVFDFAGLEYISSAGLRVLMAAHNPNSVVKGVFDITGMSGVFNIVEG